MKTWQRNLYTLWIAELIAVAGFTVVLPFLPYYVQELGVTELEQASVSRLSPLRMARASLDLFVEQNHQFSHFRISTWPSNRDGSKDP